MFTRMISICVGCFVVFSTLTVEAQEVKYLYASDTVLKLKGSDLEKKKAMELKVGETLATLSGGKCLPGETGIWTGNTFKAGCVLTAKDPYHLTHAVDATLLVVGGLSLLGGMSDVWGWNKTMFNLEEWSDLKYYGVENRPTDMGIAMWTTFGIAMGIEAVVLLGRVCEWW